MKIVQYSLNSDASATVLVGVIRGDNVLDITHIAKSSRELIAGGKDLLDRVSQLMAGSPKSTPLSEVSLQAPVTGMDKVLCIGMNYRDHCEEQGQPTPKEPLVFNKFPSCVVGPYDAIPYPPSTNKLDWEVELVIVVGKKGFQISEDDALDHVFGYTVGHDVSAREWQLQKNGGQWVVGKSMPGFAPIGPLIITRESLGDTDNLNLYCKVNGVTKQDSSTKEMVFNPAHIIAWVSKFFTILPGDIIFTGTPPGVGVFRSPPQFLHKGDTVTCGIERIGEIHNKVV